jgi:Flp pilus assembly protein TadD
VAHRRRRQDKVALGFAAARAGRLEEAEQLYREAMKEGDRNSFNNLAQLLIERGDLQQAERLFRRGIRAGDGLAAKNLALMLVEEGREIAGRRAIAVARSLGRPPTAKELAEATRFRRIEAPGRSDH